MYLAAESRNLADQGVVIEDSGLRGQTGHMGDLRGQTGHVGDLQGHEVAFQGRDIEVYHKDVPQSRQLEVTSTSSKYTE